MTRTRRTKQDSVELSSEDQDTDNNKSSKPPTKLRKARIPSKPNCKSKTKSNDESQPETKNYDADSEYSSFTDSDTPSPKRRVLRSRTADQVLDRVCKAATMSSSDSVYSKAQTQPIAAASTSCVVAIKKIIKQEPTTPGFVSSPIQGLQSSLKKSQHKNKPLKRVSFSDESFNSDSPAGVNYRFNSGISGYKKKRENENGFETSTPAHHSSKCLSQQPVVRLPRLSDVASPIVSDSKKRPLSEAVDKDSPESSGYGTMHSSADGMQGSYLETDGPKNKKPKQETETLPLTKKQQRQLAQKRTQALEEKYLAELEDLENFELVIE